MLAKITRLYGQQSNQQEARYLSEWIKDQSEGREIDLINTLRWEDDGGRLVTVEATEATLSDLR
jgi:hypothetical protein